MISLPYLIAAGLGISFALTLLVVWGAVLASNPGRLSGDRSPSPAAGFGQGLANGDAGGRQKDADDAETAHRLDARSPSPCGTAGPFSPSSDCWTGRAPLEPSNGASARAEHRPHRRDNPLAVKVTALAPVQQPEEEPSTVAPSKRYGLRSAVSGGSEASRGSALLWASACDVARRAKRVPCSAPPLRARLNPLAGDPQMAESRMVLHGVWSPVGSREAGNSFPSSAPTVDARGSRTARRRGGRESRPFSDGPEAA